MSCPCYHCLFSWSISNLSLFLPNSLLSGSYFLLQSSPLKLAPYFSTLFPSRRSWGLAGSSVHLPSSHLPIRRCVLTVQRSPAPSTCLVLLYPTLRLFLSLHVEFPLLLLLLLSLLPLVFRTLLPHPTVQLHLFQCIYTYCVNSTQCHALGHTTFCYVPDAFLGPGSREGQNRGPALLGEEDCEQGDRPITTAASAEYYEVGKSDGAESAGPLPVLGWSGGDL